MQDINYSLTTPASVPVPLAKYRSPEYASIAPPPVPAASKPPRTVPVASLPTTILLHSSPATLPVLPFFIYMKTNASLYVPPPLSPTQQTTSQPAFSVPITVPPAFPAPNAEAAYQEHTSIMHSATHHAQLRHPTLSITSVKPATWLTVKTVLLQLVPSVHLEST